MPTYIKKPLNEIWESEISETVLKCVDDVDKFKESFFLFVKNNKDTLDFVGIDINFKYDYTGIEYDLIPVLSNKEIIHELKYLATEIWFHELRDWNNDYLYKDKPIEETRGTMFDSSEVNKSDLMFY